MGTGAATVHPDLWPAAKSPATITDAATERRIDALIGTLKKSAAAVGDPMAGPWAAVLEKLNLSGTQTGLKASGATEQLTAQMEQMQSAMRATRAASLKAAQTLAESYTALVSGVLIGMSDAMRQAAVPAKKTTKK